MQEPAPGVLRTGKMSWKDEFVCYYEVEKGGMTTLNDLYMHVWHWFIKEQMPHWGSQDNKIEDFYLHRIRPDGVQENLIWWRATRVINQYICYTCKMDWQNFGSKGTEIVYNDKKVKTDKLGLVIRVWWWVQVDPSNKFEKSFLGRMMGGDFPKWWFKYMLEPDMEDHRDHCLEIARRQENELKAFFEMATNVPMPRSWFPEEGYKWAKPKPRAEDFEHLPRKPDPQI
jgi:hypothetical protein